MEKSNATSVVVIYLHLLRATEVNKNNYFTYLIFDMIITDIGAPRRGLSDDFGIVFLGVRVSYVVSFFHQLLDWSGRYCQQLFKVECLSEKG
jgi:hypothetical protein